MKNILPRPALNRLLALAILVSMTLFVPTQAEETHPAAFLDSATDSAGFQDTIEANRDKLVAEFDRWLQHALPDNTLGVMVGVDGRDAATEELAATHSTGHVWYPYLDGFYAVVTADQLHALIDHDAVTYIEPDHPIEYFLTTSVQAINVSSSGGGLDDVWKYDSSGGGPGSPIGSLETDHGSFNNPVTGRNVTVAIVDSGIDATHRDFGGWNCTAGIYEPCDSRIVDQVKVSQIWPPLVAVNPFEDQLPTTDLASGHGTHVAGTILGNGYYARNGYTSTGTPIGVAPEAKLISVSAGDSQSAGLATYAFGHIYSKIDPANPFYDPEYAKIKVISNSWGCAGGCAYSSGGFIEDYTERFYRKDILVVFAAGNSGCPGAPLSGYAASPYALGVASYAHALPTSTAGTHSTFSSCGSDNTLPDAENWDPDDEDAGAYGSTDHEFRPDVTAPGEDIMAARSMTGGTSSLVPRVNLQDGTGSSAGINPYATMSGTSMATPHVAGAGALIFDACPGVTPLWVMRGIMHTADDQTNPASQEGYGRLDARAAIDWVDSNWPNGPCA